MVTADKKIAKEADIAGDDIREVRIASSRGEPASINTVSYLLKRWSCYYIRRMCSDCSTLSLLSACTSTMPFIYCQCQRHQLEVEMSARLTIGRLPPHILLTAN